MIDTSTNERAVTSEMIPVKRILESLDCEYELRNTIPDVASDFCSLFEPVANGIAWARTNSQSILDIATSSGLALVICPKAGFPDHLAPTAPSFVLVDSPQLRYLRLVKKLSSRCPPVTFGVHPSALISEGCLLGRNVSVGPFAQIGDCRIGDDAVIGSHTIIHSGAKVGRRVLISEFCNIGGQGFSHIRNESGALENMPHIGYVVLEDDVEIFPYTNVDRGTLGTTLIGRGTKIDHYCHIGHNTRIGVDTIITANVTTAGGVVIGDECMIGVGSKMRDGIRIGNRATVGMGSVVIKDVPANQVWIGSPAQEIGQFRRRHIPA